MGVSDASVPFKKLNNYTPSNQHYISFDSLKIISNTKISKNLKEVLSANTDKKNTSKINIINTNNGFNLPYNINKNNNLVHYQGKKLSYLKNTNVSKTVDKKLTNNNINKNNIFTETNNKNNRSNKNNASYIKENSKKCVKMKEKCMNNNIKNINIHNNSSKDIIPFYYKPKRILTQKASKKSKDNKNYKNNYISNMDTSKKRKYKININNKMIKTKSKDNFNPKNIGINNINNMPGIDMHRSFNNISRLSPKDKFNINNNSSIKNKINYKIKNIADIHNYYNENKNRPIYLIDDVNNKKKERQYSNENDFNKIIRHNKENSKSKIYLDLLKLKERKWQEEIININKLISYNRTPKNKSNHISINYILQKLLLLYDNFNWLINSIGFIYSSIVYENKKDLVNINGDTINLNLPSFDSMLWYKGFIWKGLYIRIDKNINAINNIKKEIKALNYFFFDYLHIIWNDNNKIIEDSEINNTILSNNIIFPLIGYCQIHSFILIVSSIIKPERNNSINIYNIIEQSNGIIELNSNININENNIYGNKMKNKYHYKEDVKKINNNKLNNSIDFNSNINKNINK